MIKSLRHGRRRSHGPKEQWQREKERRERRTLLSFFEVKRRSGREKESGRAEGDGLNLAEYWQV